MDMGRFTADFPSYPGFVVSRLTGKFEESYFLSFISCLQTTPTGIYFNWRPTRQNGQPNWANLDNHFPMFIGDLVGHAHVNVVHGHAEVHIPLQPNNNDQQPHNHHQHNNHAVGHDHGHDHDHIHEGGAWDINEGNEAADGMPGLEPSTFELADPFEDDEWEDEEEEEFDDFFDPDPDAFPVPGEGHLDPHDADHAGECYWMSRVVVGMLTDGFVYCSDALYLERFLLSAKCEHRVPCKFLVVRSSCHVFLLCALRSLVCTCGRAATASDIGTSHKIRLRLSLCYIHGVWRRE